MLQADVAKKLKITPAALSRIERGRAKAPSASTLMKIAALFEANPDWIMHGKGQPYEIQQDVTTSELVQAIEALSPEQQATILAVIKALK